MTTESQNSAACWPQPLSDPDSAGFWEATSTGELSICRCVECALWMQPPLERCRNCAGPVGFTKVSGAASLYSWITVNRQMVPGPQVPYCVGIAELDVQAGIRLAGIIVDAETTVPTVGMPVQIELRNVPGTTFAAPVIVARSP